MTTYAKNTSVSSAGSRLEIETTLQRFGATSFAYMAQPSKAMIGFELNGKRYKFELPLPNRNDTRFTRTPGRGYVRSEKDASIAYEQEIKELWRALALMIKAILAAGEAGIISMEDALIPYLILPSGETASEWLRPQVDQVYLTGRMPQFLLETTGIKNGM